jgi:hypothetical protein
MRPKEYAEFVDKIREWRGDRTGHRSILGGGGSKYTGGFMMSGITRVPQTAPRVHDGSQTLYLNSVALCLITLPS